MSAVVYLKPGKNTEVHGKDVFLNQVAQVWCRDKGLESKCKAIKVMTIHTNQEDRFVLTALQLVEMIQKLDSHAEVEILGAQELIIDYQPKVRKIGMIDWIKTGFVCLIVFFGGAFAIMTFNNDGSVSEIFQDVDRLLLGSENGDSIMNASDVQGSAGSKPEETSFQGDGKKTVGVLTLEISYSVGLIVGVTLFFNHFGKRKVTLDPTPIEVQMRLYEDQVDTTVIQNASRKESGVDTK